MKKTLFVLILALVLALPLLGLAEDTAVPEAQPESTAPAAPYGTGRGRWADKAPAPRFQDENGDGVCDGCGQKPGENQEAPGFVDEDGDGKCDRYGTEDQYQGRGMMRGRGRWQQPGSAGRGGRGPGRRVAPGSQQFGPGRQCMSPCCGR